MTSVLKVDNIQNSSGTSALSIDSSGRVSLPKLIAFHVYKDNGSGMSPVNPVVFNNETTNVGSHYSTSTGRFTAPIAGLYKFEAAGHRQTQDSDAARLRIWKNGSTKLSESYILNGGGRGRCYVTVIAELAVNDYITIATADDDFWDGDDSGIYFQGQFLG
jgi:hypothetical protein